MFARLGYGAHIGEDGLPRKIELWNESGCAIMNLKMF